MSHRKLGHSSGGELQFAGWFDGATLAPFGSVELALCPLGGAVAVADVLGERVAEGVPVEVVGVLADELVDRAEGGLDPVEVAGVGRGRYQLDVVGVGVGTDVGCPVAGEAVLDPVEADVRTGGRQETLHSPERV